MSSRASMSRQERAQYSKIRKLLNEPGLLRGNLVEMKRKCGKTRCRCSSDAKFRHRSLYLGISLEGKSVMVYIPAGWEERVREWTSRYSELRDLLEEVSMESLDRLRKRKE